LGLGNGFLRLLKALVGILHILVIYLKHSGVQYAFPFVLIFDTFLIDAMQKLVTDYKIEFEQINLYKRLQGINKILFEF
jgi:hypothetical protein